MAGKPRDPYVQVDVHLGSSREFLAFASELREHIGEYWREVALAKLVTLWGEILQREPDGILSDVHRTVTRTCIEEWAGWRGVPGVFADAFVRHLCTVDGDHASVNGWADRYGKIAARRSKDRTRKQLSRSMSAASADDPHHDDDDVRGTGGVPKAHRARIPRVVRRTSAGHAADNGAKSPDSNGQSGGPIRVESLETPLPPPGGGGIPPGGAAAVADRSQAERAAEFNAALDHAVAPVPHEAARASIRRLLDESHVDPSRWLNIVTRICNWTQGMGTTGMKPVAFDDIAEGIEELLDNNDPHRKISTQIVLIFVEKAKRRRSGDDGRPQGVSHATASTTGETWDDVIADAVAQSQAAAP